MQTIITDKTDKVNFDGVRVDSLGTAYFTKPDKKAVQILTSAGNASLIIGPSSGGISGINGPATSVQLDGFFFYRWRYVR